MDPDGNVFTADNYFKGGKLGFTTDPISNTNVVKLYQTERYDTNFSYNFPLKPGTYNVTLYFSEFWFGPVHPGHRSFNVKGEGKNLLTDFDPLVAANGFATAYKKDFSVATTDGSLDLDFIATLDNATVDAILIKGAPGSIPTPEPTKGCDDPAIILCETFDNVNVGAIPNGWVATGSRPPSVVSTAAHSGNRSLRASAFNFSQSGYIQRSTIPAAHYGRVFYRLDKLTPVDYLHIPMVYLENATDGRQVRVVDINAGATAATSLSNLQYLINFPDDVGGASSGIFTTFTVAQTEWQCVEWRSDPATQTYTVWVNGTQRIAYKTNNLIPSTTYSKINLGMNTFRNTEESGWLDDFAVSKNRIGCN